MPPKKKQKNRNNGRNNQSFDDSRFLSEDSERRYYDIFTRRSIRVERNVVLEDFRETRIADWFETLGWTSILSARGEAIVEWVREFYSNMRDVDNNAMCFKTWVRGQEHVITVETIVALLQIKRPNKVDYPFDLRTLPAPVDYDVIASEICGFPRQWVDGLIYQNELTLEYRLLNIIVCANIEPRGHSSDISRERGFVLFAIGRGMSIDLPAMVFRTMAKIPKSTTTIGLPFGLFITQYLESKRTPWTGEERKIKVAKPINKTTLARSESHVHEQPGGLRGDDGDVDVTVAGELPLEERVELLETVIHAHIEMHQRDMEEIRGRFDRLEDMLRVWMGGCDDSGP
ncbi:hypothetical protein Acr_06g0013210 [Actinidia rufa]|uniref:Putative plant transposon protein domain-containing protein n=1 Tax=Actinidia rufa TaxID=165716 RepID=A0A7J0ESC7_9ERIC|nr:hypothetical protein Acr_06g0013210 [Actinidia rufa]